MHAPEVLQQPATEVVLRNSHHRNGFTERVPPKWSLGNIIADKRNISGTSRPPRRQEEAAAAHKKKQQRARADEKAGRTTTNNQQPTTDNKQQTTNNKQQTTNNKQQTTSQQPANRFSLRMFKTHSTLGVISLPSWRHMLHGTMSTDK